MRLPLVPTIMVAMALPILIALGIWQMGRASEKDAMLAALASAPQQDMVTLTETDWPSGLDFRRARTICMQLGQPQPRAGRSADGRPGYSYFADCAPTQYEASLQINLGWDSRPDRQLSIGSGIAVSGLLREDPNAAGRLHTIPYVLIAQPAMGGLQQSLQPGVDDIPDNHIAYAVQWFGFAAVLAIIYGIYMRSWRARAGN